jgi:hypothetical protein
MEISRVAKPKMLQVVPCQLPKLQREAKTVRVALYNRTHKKRILKVEKNRSHGSLFDFSSSDLKIDSTIQGEDSGADNAINLISQQFRRKVLKDIQQVKQAGVFCKETASLHELVSQMKKAQTEMPTVRKLEEEEVRRILKLPPPKMSFEEMVLD